MLGHTKNWGGKTFHYLKFPSVNHFSAFVKKQFTLLNDSNRRVWQYTLRHAKSRIENGSDWYGTPPPKDIQELEEHRSFLGMHLLKEVKGKFDQHFKSYLKHLEENVMPQKRLAYNDRGLGIFSFDRAAMGLFKAPRIDLSTPISQIASQLKVELNLGDVQTRSKKVFTHFENRDNSLPSLRLYIGAGANAHVEGDSLLYIGMACRELAHFMENRGVPVEINVLMGTYFSDQIVSSVIKIKGFDQSLNTNSLLLLCSDPRYFRYQGFKALIALVNHFHLNIPNGLGQITPQMHTEFKTQIDEDGFVFEQSYSLEAAAKEVSRIIEEYESITKLMGFEAFE